MIQPTLTADQASQRPWDAIVIGAGPSGATAARETALRGASVLLVDRAAFPREKICGCCLNLRVIDALRRTGLDHVLKENGAVTLRDVRIAAGGRNATLPLPDCAALSRGRFDAALIRAAIDAGVAFLPRTTAVTERVRDGRRTVSLGAADQRVSATAKLVIAAGGLGYDSAVRNAGIVARIARRSRIGAAVIVDDAPPAYAEGTTYMSSAAGGYVGLVRLEDGRLDVAAAFDPWYVKHSGGLGRAAAEVIRRAGLPELDGLPERRWHGTATLTRRPSQVACERLFLVGDAAGYVEPFTGEGIACALAGGQAVGPLALRGMERWDAALERDWTRLHRQLVVRRQFICRLMSTLLRHPVAMQLLIGALAAMPALASPFVERLNAPGYHRETLQT